MDRASRVALAGRRRRRGTFAPCEVATAGTADGPAATSGEVAGRRGVHLAGGEVGEGGRVPPAGDPRPGGQVAGCPPPGRAVVSDPAAPRPDPERDRPPSSPQPERPTRSLRRAERLRPRG